MNIVLFGAGGQLGQAFVNHHQFSQFGTEYLTRAALDICDFNAVSALLAQRRPDVVINCAAYTGVDDAEQHKQKCMAVNCDAVAHLAQQCQQHGILLIQFSTDYVFDGKKAAAYNEQDLPNPLNFYGLTKWLAEQQVRQYCNKYLILRTSWLFSEYGHNFYRTMLKLAKDKPQLNVIADQFGCPTYAGDIASIVLNLLHQFQQQGSLAYGTYHVASGPVVSWFDFAMMIFDVKQLNVVVKPIASSQWPAKARRPVNSALDCSKVSSTFGIVVPKWPASLKKLIMEQA